MNAFIESRAFKKLLSLHLPFEDYAIFGSGPMVVHGLKELSDDVDVIATRIAWDIVQTLGEVKENAPDFWSIKLFDGEVEIGNMYSPGVWDINELIANAEIIDGIRFVQLETVLAWKKILGRPKDIEHIKLIEKYLQGIS